MPMKAIERLVEGAMEMLMGESWAQLGLLALCSAVFWWWCWAYWGRRQSRSSGESVGLTRRSVGRSSSESGSNSSTAGGGGEGRRIPRGSTGWPLIGETLDFIACGYTSRPESFMEKRRNLYGRVFKSHILGRPIVVSTDAEVNRAVLQSEGFVPSYPRSVVELLGEASILNKEGTLHRRMHGLIAGFVKSPTAKACVAEAIERALVQSMGRWQEGQLVYVQDVAKEVTFRALLKVLLGIEPGKELDFFRREYTEFIQGLICLPIKLPGTRLYKSLKAKEKMLKLLRKIVEERIQKGERGSVKDVVDALLNETYTNEQQQILVDSICENIIEMMIPGEHSVPMLMTLAVKYMSDSPLALKQLTEENINLKREKINRREPYSWTDYMSLTFTQHVISESLRMGNIVNGVWRKAVKDIEIKGYLIPKDWCVVTSFTSIHLDEENYSNPHEFNPWRWQRKGISLSNFTPFGGGQRLCPGQDLSRLEISVFLHHLVTSYSWVAEEDTVVNFPTVKLKKKMPIRISAIST